MSWFGAILLWAAVSLSVAYPLGYVDSAAALAAIVAGLYALATAVGSRTRWIRKLTLLRRAPLWVLLTAVWGIPATLYDWHLDGSDVLTTTLRVVVRSGIGAGLFLGAFYRIRAAARMAGDLPPVRDEAVEERVNAYGALLARFAGVVAVDERVLPCSKEEMKATLRRAYELVPNEQLRMGYAELSKFRPDVGPEPIRDLLDGVPEDVSSEADLRRAAQQIASRADDVSGWMERVNEEFETLLSETSAWKSKSDGM